MLACLDVYYSDTQARAACVLFHDWSDESAAAEHVAVFADVAPYEPGNFFRRELPPLLGVLDRVAEPLETIVIDGYAWLDEHGRPGLGAHLHAAVGTPVIGVAKSNFRDAPAIPVLRGGSQTPLFVSAAGMPAEEAARNIARMSGDFRIPTLLKRADQLSRRGL